MKSLKLASLLYFLSTAAWAVESRVIACTAKSAAHSVEIRLDERQLELKESEQEPQIYRVTKQEVVGVGVKARHVYTLDRGKASFHDTYGCLSQIRIELSDRQDLLEVECHRVQTTPSVCQR